MKIDKELYPLARPIEFSLRKNFANLAKIKGLESTLIKALDEIKDLLPSPIVEDLSLLIKGLDLCSEEKKKEKILKIYNILKSLKNKTSQDILEPLAPYPDIENYKKIQKELKKPVQFLKGIGPKIAQKLSNKEIFTVEDLLYFLPKAYEDRRKFTPLSETRVGMRVTVKGEIVLAGIVRFKRRRVFEIVISDGKSLLAAKWFHFQSQKYKDLFKPGKTVILSGEITFFAGRKEIIHPEVEFLDKKEDLSLHVGRIVPIYPSIEGISPKIMRRILARALEKFIPKITSFIPHEILKRRRLVTLSQALKGLHFPPQGEDLEVLNQEKSIYHKSLAFDELFFLELAMALRRSRISRKPGISFDINSSKVELFLKGLPFQLTQAQVRTFEEIKEDMSRPYPMNRLIQGDVGSGKTVVAFLAALLAIDNGYQVALMAPTEILAEQHFTNFRQLAGLSGVQIALLTGGKSLKEKKEIYKGLEQGFIHFVIGTHALFQEKVQFKNLGLVIIDEQHRFGVLQRAALREKAQGVDPDTLVMTATPIPRTLAMTVYGDLDVSLIDEMPKGRRPVETILFLKKDKSKAYSLIKQELQKGHQAYVVFPLIEESQKLDLLAANSMAEYLQKEIFPHYQVGLLHGKMPSKEKDRIMKKFKEGKIQILVSTTVIEVGVDVPTATVIMIENAERFGLSQLHQLRGRVGRSDKKSYCLLMANKLRPGTEAYKRLRILCETNDGFRIAEEDMKIRGPGELLGTKQSGFLKFRRADLIRDYDMLVVARKEAFALIEKDPFLSLPEHEGLKLVLMERWAERLKLSEVA